MQNIKMTLRYEKKENVLKKPLLKIDHSASTLEEIASYNKHSDDTTKVVCIMLATMVRKLANFYEDY